MAIRLTSNANPWVREHPTFQDMNDTNTELQTISMIGIAQNAYQTLQANNVFENKDYLAADEFTDTTGTNNTVNTGTTTSIYNSVTDTYNLNSGSAEASNIAAGSFTQVSGMTWTGVVNNAGYISAITLSTHNTGSDWTGTIEIKNSGSTTIASKSVVLDDNDTNQVTTFASTDYSAIFGATDTFSVVMTRTSGSGTLRTASGSASYNGTLWDLTGTGNYDGTEGSYQEVRTFGIVVCDTDIKTLDGTESAICVYADKTVPTNTTMTVDISDGTTTLSAQPLNEVISISTLTAVADLELTFNLATTDTTTTPLLKGYGVYIK